MQRHGGVSSDGSMRPARDEALALSLTQNDGGVQAFVSWPAILHAVCSLRD
jgi:hypothetical protein